MPGSCPRRRPTARSHRPRHRPRRGGAARLRSAGIGSDVPSVCPRAIGGLNVGQPTPATGERRRTRAGHLLPAILPATAPGDPARSDGRADQSAPGMRGAGRAAWERRGCRGSRIRTGGLPLPKRTRYQAAPYPVCRPTRARATISTAGAAGSRLPRALCHPGTGQRGRSSMVEPQSSKLITRVRFSSPARI